MSDTIEVPADAVLNELVNSGILSNQVLQLAANKVAMQMQLERSMQETESLRAQLPKANPEKDE